MWSGAYLSHHTAAGILGIRQPHTGEVELTLIGRDAARRRPGLRVHRTIRLDRRDVRSHDGLVITSAARTVIDIAPDLTENELDLALNEALVRKLVTVWQFRHVLDRYPTLPGSGRVRTQLAPDWPAGVPQPGGERVLLPHVMASGLPRPLVNHKLGRWRPDLYWPEAVWRSRSMDLTSTAPVRAWNGTTGRTSRSERRALSHFVSPAGRCAGSFRSS